MMQVIDTTTSEFDIRPFVEEYSSAVRAFGESISPTWVDDKIGSIANGQEFCIGAVEEGALKGILSYGFRDMRGDAFVTWGAGEADREGLLLLIREYVNRSPREFKLRISGLHPNIRQELMSTVSESLGFVTRSRFEMVCPLGEASSLPDEPINYTTSSIINYDETVLSRLDWEAFSGTTDQKLFFDTEEQNRKMLKSLLSGDYGPVISDASMCVLLDDRPEAMIAVTDVGESAFIADIAVSSRLRGKGVGRYLLTNALKAAGRLKKDKMVLWVSDDNAPAISLYKSMGFTVSRTGVYHLKAE